MEKKFSSIDSTKANMKVNKAAMAAGSMDSGLTNAKLQANEAEKAAEIMKSKSNKAQMKANRAAISAEKIDLGLIEPDFPFIDEDEEEDLENMEDLVIVKVASDDNIDSTLTESSINSSTVDVGEADDELYFGNPIYIEYSDDSQQEAHTSENGDEDNADLKSVVSETALCVKAECPAQIEIATEYQCAPLKSTNVERKNESIDDEIPAKKAKMEFQAQMVDKQKQQTSGKENIDLESTKMPIEAPKIETKAHCEKQNLEMKIEKSTEKGIEIKVGSMLKYLLENKSVNETKKQSTKECEGKIVNEFRKDSESKNEAEMKNIKKNVKERVKKLERVLKNLSYGSTKLPEKALDMKDENTSALDLTKETRAKKAAKKNETEKQLAKTTDKESVKVIGKKAKIAQVKNSVKKLVTKSDGEKAQTAIIQGVHLKESAEKATETVKKPVEETAKKHVQLPNKQNVKQNGIGAAKKLSKDSGKELPKKSKKQLVKNSEKESVLEAKDSPSAGNGKNITKKRGPKKKN